MKHILLILCFLVVGDALDCSNMDSYFMDIKIRKKLFCNYDPYIRPQERVDLSFDFILKAFDFSNSNVMNFQSWIALGWNDSRLKFDPSEFEENDRTFASIDLLWVPDIALMESDTLEDINSCTAVDCNIYSTGYVECPLQCEQSANCKDADHTNWPFDIASCQFTFMSRTHSTKTLNIIGQTLMVDKEISSLNREWEIFSMLGYSGNQSGDFFISSLEQNANYSFIKIDFTIKRHSPEIIYQFLIPAAVIIFINIFILLLDANMSERWILYAFGIFSNWIYNVQLQYLLPSNSDSVPKVFVFICDSQIITTFLMFESLMLKIYIESEEDESEWIKIVMNFIKRSWYGQVIYQDTISTVKNDGSTFRFNFSRLIDRFLIIILTVLYAVMFYGLMPTQMKEMDSKSNNMNFETDF